MRVNEATIPVGTATTGGSINMVPPSSDNGQPPSGATTSTGIPPKEEMHQI